MGRIGQLEGQVKRLEQEKRRTQRLLLLTRKSLRAPLTTGHRGRWPNGRGVRYTQDGEFVGLLEPGS